VTVSYGNFHGDFMKRPDKYGTPGASHTLLGQDFTIENGETIYWSNIEAALLEYAVLEDDIFADIIIKADGVIVGYAVVEIESPSGRIGGLFLQQFMNVCIILLSLEDSRT